MLDIMAGTDQKSTVMSVFGWFAGDSAPRPVFLPAVRPKMRCIMADIDQMYSCVNAWVVLLVKMQLALCPFFVDRPKMLGIRAGMAQKNSYAAIQFMASFGCVPFCRRQFGAQVPVRIRVRIRVFGQGLHLSLRGPGAHSHAVFPAAVHRP